MDIRKKQKQMIQNEKKYGDPKTRKSDGTLRTTTPKMETTDRNINPKRSKRRKQK